VTEEIAPGASRDAAPASSVGGYYPWLDALRGISWILVMIGHTIVPLGFLARLGVGIFFAISGWLITRIILGQLDRKWSLVSFYTRRAIRIIPLYYVLIALAVSASLIAPRWYDAFEWLPEPVPEFTLWRHLLTFATEQWRGGAGGYLVGHAWSLGVEERFYVFWPLLLTLWPGAVAARRVLVVALIVLYAAALLVLPTPDVTTALWALPFPLLLGCALAIFAPFRLQACPWRVTLPAGAAVFAAYVVYADLVERSLGPTICVFGLLPGVLAVLLTAAAVATAGDSTNLAFRALREAGKVSYAAYLFHPIFAFLAIKAARAIGAPWLAPVLGIAMIGPIALGVHRYVETPFLNLRPRIERSGFARAFLTTLQTVPIFVGLVFLFPWADLADQFSTHRGLAVVAAAALLAAIVGAAVKAGQGWGHTVLDRAARLGATVRRSVRDHGTPVLSALHLGLRRSAPVLTVLAAVAAGVVVLVALTGGFRWTFGGVVLSVRKMDRPTQLLSALLSLRFAAAVDPQALARRDPE
jgi:peptidoglycan/LPS O-acetylase OafA/YrhL